MKFKEFVENVNELLKDRPETADFDVVYSSDDEGNGYNILNYGPNVGFYDGSYNGEWLDEDTIDEEIEEDFDEGFEIEIKNNSVCIN